MLEAHYRPREGRVHTGLTRATLGGSRRLRLVAEASTSNRPTAGDVDELLDLSTRGMKIRTRAPAPQAGDGLLIELRHPEVRGAVMLRGEVRWVEADGDGRSRIGVAFVFLRDTTAVALEQLIALELGSSVLGPRGHLGYLARQPGEVPGWLVYDLERQPLARLHAGPASLVLTRDQGHHECADLAHALATVFGEVDLRVVPQLRVP